MRRCFKSGDSRVNEHIGLAALQTLWAREHNRLAETLQLLNPHWPDEVLFQEARKIVIAQIQYITYTEFLPLILGQVSTYLRFVLFYSVFFCFILPFFSS